MYKVIRMYQRDYPSRVIKRHLTLAEAQEHCSNPETSSSTCKKAKNIQRTNKKGPWFDGYSDE
jgi:hypothetical protein